jgi:hypothetical protein
MILLIEDIRNQASTPSSNNNIITEKKRIMIVDDELDIANLYTLSLERDGFFGLKVFSKTFTVSGDKLPAELIVGGYANHTRVYGPDFSSSGAYHLLPSAVSTFRESVLIWLAVTRWCGPSFLMFGGKKS